jgi:hypothetical protein
MSGRSKNGRPRRVRIRQFPFGGDTHPGSWVEAVASAIGRLSGIRGLSQYRRCRLGLGAIRQSGQES